MKLLHALPSLDPRDGGPVQGLVSLAEGLRALGVDSEVAVLDAPDAAWLAQQPFPVHALGPARGTYRRCPAFRRWFDMHRSDYDAIIVHGLWGYQGYAVWKGLRGGGPPYCVFPHGMLDPWFKRRYPLKHLKKWLYWPWGQYPVLRDARAVLFTCEDERELARQSFWLYRARERVVGFGARAPGGDPAAQRAAFLAAFPELAGRRLLLFVGRLHEKKGCDLLIEAFAAVAAEDPALCLVFAGPDQTGWQAALQDLAQARGVADRVVFTGMIGGDVKWGAFRAADAFVLPSHQENFGVVVAEALACGLPVLVSNKINIWREVVQDRVGLVEEDDLDGTVRLLRRWLALDAAQRDAMRRRAPESFAARFDMAAVAARLVALLREGSEAQDASVAHPQEAGR